VDSDFAGVEKLLEDFKARSESSEDRQAVEDQMKYLVRTALYYLAWASLMGLDV
jgi:hypothetical protein